jgi:hypothetical protein
LQDNFGGERLTFDAQPEQTLLMVVDGYSRSTGSYQLGIDCLCGPTATQIAEGAWRLQVSRRWNGDSAITTPSAPLDEADYQPVEDGPVYEV